MNNDNRNDKSIHEFDFQLICEYFSSIQRQGPGSDEMTRKALGLVTGLDSQSVIADLGCGTGSQTLQLALCSPARVKALDLFPMFIDALRIRCLKAGVADRVEGQVGDMAELPFDCHSLDVIWSEGAIYNIGFQKGIALWYEYLKAGGWLVVSEATWFTDERPEEIEKFWLEAYPEIDTVRNKVKQMEEAGYHDVATFNLPKECWTVEYYEKQKEAQRIFLERYPDSHTAKELVANQRREAELYDRYHDFYGYTFFIGRI